MKIIKYQLATEINHGTPEEPDIETDFEVKDRTPEEIKKEEEYAEE